MTLTRKSYTAGHFELMIDGHRTTAYLKSVEGGHVNIAPVKQSIGGSNKQIKHSSVAEIEPFSIDCGIAGGQEIIRWIQASWNKNYSRRTGQITHANFDLQPTYEHEFFDALITEATFPALDGSSKETAFLKLKVQPERVLERKVTSGSKIDGALGTKQKLWMASSFRLNIDGMPSMQYTNKIDSFTIKQGIKKLYTGEDKFPQIEPTKIEFPNLSGTISLEYADDLFNWYQEALGSYMGGVSDPRSQKTGSLEYLAPDRKTVLFSIELFEIGIAKAQIMASQANQDSIKRVKWEFFVGRMDIDGGGILGME
ncbi:MAG: phage tail protein [Myxococcota bacterium]|nr:phage tail protein [Myxococcota bacterium]